MCATVLAKEIDISLFLSLLDPVWLVASRGGERERSSDDAQYSRRRRFFFFSGLSIIPPPPLAQDAQISPTHTHTQPKWRRLFFPRLCNFYLFLFSKIINKKRRFILFDFFFCWEVLSLKMDRIPLHFSFLLWGLSITGS